MVIVYFLWKSDTCCWNIKYKNLIEVLQEQYFQQQENEEDQIRNIDQSECFYFTVCRRQFNEDKSAYSKENGTAYHHFP